MEANRTIKIIFKYNKYSIYSLLEAIVVKDCCYLQILNQSLKYLSLNYFQTGLIKIGG